MKTYPIENEDGQLNAFEIDNLLIGRQGVVRIVERIPEAVIIQRPKLLSWLREDVFCRLEVGQQAFTVEEPFGDNSRYLVGAEPPGWCPQLEVVEKAFREA